MSNQTEPIIPADCAQLDWCLKAYGEINYVPSLAGNALFLALFLVALLAQVGLAIRFKTWGYLVAMFGGIGLEIVGYIARIELHNDIFNRNYFIIYLVGLTIGPAFFSAAVYLSLSRIMSIFGSDLSWCRPKMTTIIFICCDLLSLVLQAVGGAIASEASTNASGHTGVNIMIAGLSTQVASTVAFCAVCMQLAWAVRRYPQKINQDYHQFRNTMRWKLYLVAIAIATITILVRCTFRVAELSEGFGGKLANDEPLFMVLDGAMMIICSWILTIAHPGLALGPLWNVGAFHWRSKKDAPSGEKDLAPSSRTSDNHRAEESP